MQFSLTKLVASLFAQRSAPAQLVQPEWLGQHHATRARKQRREIIAHLGRRQGIKWIKHIRAQRRANRDELSRAAA